jgi:hypothetical protein
MDRSLIAVLVFLDPHRRWRPQVASAAIDVSAIVQDWRNEDLITGERAKDLLTQAAAAGLTAPPPVAAVTDRDRNVR